MLLPDVFDSQDETIPFMARMKNRASKNFRWTSSRCLEDAMYVAYWSHVFYRDDDALQVCDFLSPYQFTGNYDLWGWVEGALALQSRLLRGRGETEKAAECVQRIWNVGFLETRLVGSLIPGYEFNVSATLRDGRAASSRDWRAIYAVELCALVELSGSPEHPRAPWEERWQDNLVHLRTAVGVSRT